MVQKWGKNIMAIVGIDNPASATAADIAALPADAFAGATADGGAGAAAPLSSS